MWNLLGIDIPTALAGVVALTVWLVRTRKKQRYTEHKEAFEIHEALSTGEVFQATATADAASKNYLVALHRRTSARYLQFRDAWPLPVDLARLIEEQFLAIHKIVPKATEDSQAAFISKQSQKQQQQDHSKNPRVQAQIEELARQLETLGGPIASVKRSREGAGQSMWLTQTNGTRIYVAGSKDGTIPSAFQHDHSGCQLNTAAAKRSLEERHNGSMAALAADMVGVLRQNAGTTCTCGEDFP